VFYFFTPHRTCVSFYPLAVRPVLQSAVLTGFLVPSPTLPRDLKLFSRTALARFDDLVFTWFNLPTPFLNVLRGAPLLVAILAHAAFPARRTPGPAYSASPLFFRLRLWCPFLPSNFMSSFFVSHVRVLTSPQPARAYLFFPQVSFPFPRAQMPIHHLPPACFLRRLVDLRVRPMGAQLKPSFTVSIVLMMMPGSSLPITSRLSSWNCRTFHVAYSPSPETPGPYGPPQSWPSSNTARPTLSLSRPSFYRSFSILY